MDLIEAIGRAVEDMARYASYIDPKWALVVMYIVAAVATYVVIFE